MPPLFGKTPPLKRTIAAMCLGLCLLWTSAYAQQYRGKVIDRNGTPQGNCQIEFSERAGQPVIFRATANRDGIFYLTNPRQGKYYVVVGYGPQKQFSVFVTIDAQGLQPATLIATW